MRNLPLTVLYGVCVTLSAEYFHLLNFLCHFAATNKSCYEKVQTVYVRGTAPATVFL